MDVTGHTFQTQLFSILGAISRSHFVSFDLELTGIPGKQFKSKPTGQSEDGRQTLQQRYEETKAAASRYQILQLGLTCVEEKKDRGTRLRSKLAILVSLNHTRGLCCTSLQLLSKSCARQEVECRARFLISKWR